MADGGYKHDFGEAPFVGALPTEGVKLDRKRLVTFPTEGTS